MNRINAYQERYLKTALLRKLLEGDRLFRGHHVKEGSRLAPAYLVRQILVSQILVRGIYVLVRRALARRNVARRYVLAHLADFLIESHLAKQGLRPL